MCFPRRSPVPATVLALVLLATVGSSRAQADSVQETEHPVSVPSTELRLVGAASAATTAAWTRGATASVSAPADNTR